MNNPDPLEKFFRNSSKVVLDSKSKNDIHQEVLQFVKNNPFEAKSIAPKWFGWQIPSIINLKIPAVALAGMLLFLGVGGIASVQADSSLPGDFLYPMKVGFNEKIKEVLAFSDEAKLHLNIKLTEVRLEEAKQLIVKNKMTGAYEAEINDKFKDRANKASIYIDKINKKKPNNELTTTTANFEASLKAEKVILDDAQKYSTSKVTESFINDLDDVTLKISDRHNKIKMNASGKILNDDHEDRDAKKDEPDKDQPDLLEFEK